METKIKIYTDCTSTVITNVDKTKYPFINTIPINLYCTLLRFYNFNIDLLRGRDRVYMEDFIRLYPNIEDKIQKYNQIWYVETEPNIDLYKDYMKNGIGVIFTRYLLTKSVRNGASLEYLLDRIEKRSLLFDCEYDIKIGQIPENTKNEFFEFVKKTLHQNVLNRVEEYINNNFKTIKDYENQLQNKDLIGITGNRQEGSRICCETGKIIVRSRPLEDGRIISF